MKYKNIMILSSLISLITLVWSNFSYANTQQNTQYKTIEYTKILTQEWQRSFFSFSSFDELTDTFFNQWKIIYNKNWSIWIPFDFLEWTTSYNYITLWLWDSYFSNHQKKLSRYLTTLFRKESQTILNKLNQRDKLDCKSFDTKIKRFSTFPLILNYSNYLVLISKDDLTTIITCYLRKNEWTHALHWQINTLYWDARVHNIWKWLTFMNWLWKKWEELSVYKKVWNQIWYQDWYAIFYKDWKYIHKLVEWWWLCWISSVLYQWILKWYWSFNITERYPHSEFRSTYYNHLWIDATIFWIWDTPTRDLKIVNTHTWDIIIQWYDFIKEKNAWYVYWIKLWSLQPFQKTYFKHLFTKWNCVNTWIYDESNNWLVKSINSCYQWWIFQ